MADSETTLTVKPPSRAAVSLFCGLGGLDLGFLWEDFNIIWANDNSAHAIKTHQLNFRTEAICSDITEIPIKAIPDADVIIGGPPCQSFSLLGQRQKDDPRGKLVFRFLEIVKAKRPLAFVMENVPGMAASRVGGIRLPDVLQEAFAKLDYQVSRLNLIATDYLVPQLRRRIFLVGCLNARPEQINSVQYAKECYGIDPRTFDISAKAAIGDLGLCTGKGERAKYRDEEPSEFAKLMRYANLRDVSLHEKPRMSKTDELLVSHIPPGGNYTDIPDEIAPGRVLKFKELGGRTTTYGRLHPDKPSYTINTYFRRPNVGCNFHYAEPRLITPREAMRFQSIPDHFELSYGAQDQRNALIGNAVPPLMARAVAWSLRHALESPDACADQGSVVTHNSSQLSFF
jgi:DNA (cytosine-5)-methyltransferase 1